MHVTEPWVETPLRQFVDETRVQMVVLMHPSGQVLAQDGFTRSSDVMSACALSAAIHASASELGRQLEGHPFRDVHYAGAVRQMFLGTIPTPRGNLLLLAIFDDRCSLGLLQVFLVDLRKQLAAATPPVGTEAPALAANFEQDLNRNLAVLFGRA
jgi:hypothetical protein